MDRLAGALLLVLLAPVCDGAERSSWLEGAVVSWNKPGAGVAKAPAAASPDPRCLETARAAASKPDTLVVESGWTLVGAVQVFGSTRAFLASAGFDGMCRPVDYQGFVFADGKFAGTLSPVPMRSRSDGSLTTLRLTSKTSLSADFARYLDQDPLCCPSRLASVSYRIESAPTGPLLVAGPARVEPAP